MDFPETDTKTEMEVHLRQTIEIGKSGIGKFVVEIEDDDTDW